MIAAPLLTRPHTCSSFICHSFSSCQVWRKGWPGTCTTMTDYIHHHFKYCVNGQANWGGGPPCCKDMLNTERKILQRSCSSSCAKYWLSSVVKRFSGTIVKSFGRRWDSTRFAECDVGICLQVNGEWWRVYGSSYTYFHVAAFGFPISHKLTWRQNKNTCHKKKLFQIQRQKYTGVF
jgi:hypothetical protein